ncbi:hypothetical protein LTR84_012150 [Exophiala bonariae]|uniref:Transcription factor IIIC subunit 5 HTH domain-containing protein n=1 Tax=Exophiala bonariae TaxID=1690606 RepID=A0AAV9NHP2_9EURO|nr:hypothetical protein LTR84_012150 [Exophiala bonariae]
MESRSAPWLQASAAAPVLSVEHPCIVQNVDRAIHMLGGSEEIGQHLKPETDKPLGLKFQPDDPACRPIIALRNDSNNVLLQFTVPRRTGRKRKRGSDDPFVKDPAPEPLRKDASYLLRSMVDNPEGYQVDVVGSIQSTHVWRTIPDFVYSVTNSSAIDELKSKILPQQYPLIEKWSLPQTYGLTDTETFPPPILSVHSLPLNYSYRQNPAVTILADPQTGKKSLYNLQKAAKVFTHQSQFDDPVWPDKPHPRCPPLSQQNPAFQDVCKSVLDLFEQRPIWTRRALVNQLPLDVPLQTIRHATAYVCFAIRSGPWRDTLCKFGVDPRKDPSHRKYQTVLVQLVNRHKDKPNNREDFTRTWHRSADQESHIFTGKSTIPTDGKSWQLCDLHEPHLKALVDTSDVYIRHDCETRYFGWYANGTMAKMRVAIKAMIDSVIDGTTLDMSMLERFLLLPEDIQWTLGQNTPAHLPKNTTKQEQEWASSYRSLCRTVGGNVPTAGGSGKGRLSKPKPLANASFVDQGDVDNVDGMEDGDEEGLYGDEGDDDNMEQEEQEEQDSGAEEQDVESEQDEVETEIP